MIDKKQLLSHFDQDKGLIEELVSLFEQTYPAELAALKQAINTKNFSEIELRAHTLKGMISNFFDAELKEISCKLEKLGRERENLELEKLISEFEEKIPPFILALKRL